MKAKKKLLNKSEAWAAVAREFRKPRRTLRNGAGICNALRLMFLSGEITNETYERLAKELDVYMHDSDSCCFLWSTHTRYGKKKRAELAEAFARRRKLPVYSLEDYLREGN